MKRCKARKKNGEPCSCSAVGKSGFCYFHDPATAHKRVQHKHGGRRTFAVALNTALAEVVRKPRTIVEVMTVLDYALDQALQEINSVARNRLLVTIASAYMEAFSVGAIEQRLAALEIVAGLRIELPILPVEGEES